MMKSIIAMALMLGFLNLSLAEKVDTAYQVVEFRGVVRSHDKKSVTLENSGRTQKFDRAAFPQKSLKAGQIVTAYYKYKSGNPISR